MKIKNASLKKEIILSKFNKNCKKISQMLMHKFPIFNNKMHANLGRYTTSVLFWNIKAQLKEFTYVFINTF